MRTTPLFEFMKARIAEDEAQANAVDLLSSGVDAISTHHLPEFSDFQVRWQPDAVRAECAAKLAIVQYAEALWFENGRDADTAARYRSILWAVQRMASAYSEHPDHPQEWALGG